MEVTNRRCLIRVLLNKAVAAAQATQPQTAQMPLPPTQAAQTTPTAQNAAQTAQIAARAAYDYLSLGREALPKAFQEAMDSQLAVCSI